MSWPIEAKNVKKIQIEISNYCNARCPQCARELIFDGKVQPKHIGINDNFITLEQFKSWFDKDNWEDLFLLDFCGSYDEPTTNPDLIKIVKWIMSYKGFNNYLKVNISTNGGTRNKEFWKELAEIGSANLSPEGTKRIQVNWGIDGLEDTNHIYRVNVKWDKLQENFRTFIKHGGRAWWQFIYFSHNEHQDQEAKQRSIDEGFEGIKWRGSKGRDAIEKVKQASTPKFQLENEKPATKIQCKALSRPNYFGLDTGLYVTNRGTVLPCCWVGTETEMQNLYDKHGYKYNILDNVLSGKNSFQEILDSPWYNGLHAMILKETWRPCTRHCKENVISTINNELHPNKE
jgi:hypothetical protein